MDLAVDVWSVLSWHRFPDIMLRASHRCVCTNAASVTASLPRETIPPKPRTTIPPAPHRTRIPPNSQISPTATISSSATLSPFCSVGPFSRLHARTFLHPHASIGPHVTVGAGSTVFPHAAVGRTPQDAKYSDEPTRTTLGTRCSVRDGAVVERGTASGRGVTSLGAGVLLMAHAYIGHDAKLGQNVVVANAASLAGHVEVADTAVIGGHAALHQRVRVGKGAIVGGMTPVRRDVLPFCVVSGNPPLLRGLNYKRLWPRLDFAHRRVLVALFRTLFPALGRSVVWIGPLPPSLAQRVDLVDGLDVVELAAQFRAEFSRRQKGVGELGDGERTAGQLAFLTEVVDEITLFIRLSEGGRGIHVP